MGISEVKNNKESHLEKIQGFKPLSNTKTAEEIRDGSPSFTIDLAGDLKRPKNDDSRTLRS